MHFFERIFLIIILIILTKTLYAQSSKIDSLQLVLKKTTHDSTKSDIYDELSKFYFEEDLDTSLYYSNQNEYYSARSKDAFRKGRALHTKGIYYDYANQLDSCLYFLSQADTIFTQVNRLDRRAAVIGDIGLAHYLRGNNELALRNFLKSLDIMKQHSLPKDQAKMMNNIGLVYKSRNNFDMAIQYYLSSLEIKKQLNDEVGILNTTINIGTCFQMQDKFDSAYHYANLSMIMAEKLHSLKDIITCKVNMATTLASTDRTILAKQLLIEVEKEVKSNHLNKMLPSIYESYGTIYTKEKNYQLALNYFLQALELATQTSSLKSMEICERKIAMSYASLGNYNLAYSHLQISQAYKDSLVNIESAKQMNEMTVVYETEKKEKEIEKLHLSNLISQSKLDARRKERNYFIISTLLFIGLTGLAYKAFTNNRKKKNQLNVQNDLIEKSLSEKEILLKEIHHRVKNNLQIVSSLLSLQSNSIQDEKALDAIRESKNRVQSMAIIHQNLYQDESLINIDVKEYVEKLVEYLFHSYNIQNNNIQLEMDIQAIRLDIDTLVPLGLVMNELISNSLKYAFPNQGKGFIKVSLYHESDILKLSVYDNGIGIPSNHSNFNQNSFGHKMIHAFMKKLKGSIRIYNDDGTKVDIEIKNFKMDKQ